MKYTDKQVFEIGLPGAHDAGNADSMGFKAFNLARMAHIGLKVPEAFVLGTAICRDFLKHPAKSRAALLDLLSRYCGGWRPLRAWPSAARANRCWSRCAPARRCRCRA